MPTSEDIQRLISSELSALKSEATSELVKAASASFTIDQNVIADKELRRDLDAQLQKLRGLPASRERSLCITKLQECIMWLGMDLKRLADLRPNPVAPTKTLRELAVAAYARYGAVTDFKNFRGEPMPEFAALSDTIKQAWEAAVSADNGRPYPSSYDPSNAKVEPTAEGLKL